MKKHIETLIEIVDLYEIFLIDIWGGVHNGANLYPNILSVLDFLKRKNKRVIFISNSAKLRRQVKQDLIHMGMNRNLFETVYTAGDSFYLGLKELSQNLQKKWFVLDCNNISNVANDLMSLNQTLTLNYREADTIIIASIQEFDLDLTSYSEFITHCIDAKPTIYSMNPDVHVITSRGRLARPGLLTRQLQKAGVNVTQYGKPELSFFLEVIGYTGAPKEKHIMIGDSLSTDIKGATKLGIDSILIYGSYAPSDALTHYEIPQHLLKTIDKKISIKMVESLLLKMPPYATYYLEQLKI